MVALLGLVRRPTEAQQIASGTTALDADGKFEIDFTPAADEQREEGRSHLSYRLESRRHRRRRRDAQRRAHGAPRLGGGRDRAHAGEPRTSRSKGTSRSHSSDAAGSQRRRRARERADGGSSSSISPSPGAPSGRSAAAAASRSGGTGRAPSRPRATGCARAGAGVSRPLETLALFADGNEVARGERDARRQGERHDRPRRPRRRRLSPALRDARRLRRVLPDAARLRRRRREDAARSAGRDRLRPRDGPTRRDASASGSTAASRTLRQRSNCCAARSASGAGR